MLSLGLALALSAGQSVWAASTVAPHVVLVRPADGDAVELDARSLQVEVTAAAGNTLAYRRIRVQLLVDDTFRGGFCEAPSISQCTFVVSVEPGEHTLQGVLTLIDEAGPTAGFTSPVARIRTR